MTDLPADAQPDPETDRDPATPASEDDGAALERAADSIHEAREAESTVAAHDDITSDDDERAGQHSEDPDGEGGHP